MLVAVIADAHIGGPGGPADELVEQLAGLPEAGCRHLVLLGDLLHVWIGFRQFETDDVRRVADALAELRRRGVRVDYIEGNRDFFLAGSAYGESFDSVGNEVGFSVGERRVLAVHGDGLDPRDRPYRFWRWLSKNAASRWAMEHFPPRLARRILDDTERRLGKTNFAHKREIPGDILRRYGRRRLAEGYDLLLVGHYHESRNWSVPGGEVQIIDAWFRSRRIEWLCDTPPGTPSVPPVTGRSHRALNN